MSSIEIAVNSVHEMLRREGKINLQDEPYPWQDVTLDEFLLSNTYIANPDPDDMEARDFNRIAFQDLYQWIWMGFFKCAADGYEFLPESIIKEKYGKTLEENYLGAGDHFLRFSKTFWTLRVVESNIKDYNDLIVFTLISELNHQIQNIFFPNHPSSKVNIGGVIDDREHTQRQLLSSSGVGFDIDAFIAGNPIIRDSRNGGCLGVLTLLFIPIAVYILFSSGTLS